MNQANVSTPEELRQQRLLVFGLAMGGVLFIALLIAAIWGLLANPELTTTIKEIVTIGVALMLVLITLTLVILVVQLARLVNLVQNEVQPLLDSANDTMNTLRGTAEFLSENLSEPVIKLNSYLSGVRKLLDTLDVLKKPFQK